MFGRGILATKTNIEEKLLNLAGHEGVKRLREGVYDRWITEPDIQEIARLGFNSVRIPLHRHSLEGNTEPRCWPYVDRVLTWCETHGLWAIIDLHAAPGGQSGWPPADPRPKKEQLWNNEEAQARTISIWREIASRYKGRSVVAGYDLLNEPWPPDGRTITAFYEKLVRAIRESDPDHLIFTEGGTFGYNMHEIEKVLDPQHVLSFHMYTWFDDTRAKHIKRYVQQAKKMDLPVWCGEFGENSAKLIRSTVEMYEDPAAGFSGWSFWPWKRCPAWFPGLRIVSMPEDWTKTINWLGGWVAWKPSKEVALKGIDDFLDAMTCAKNTTDQAILSALLGPAPIKTSI